MVILGMVRLIRYYNIPIGQVELVTAFNLMEWVKGYQERRVSW